MASNDFVPSSTINPLPLNDDPTGEKTVELLLTMNIDNDHNPNLNEEDDTSNMPRRHAYKPNSSVPKTTSSLSTTGKEPAPYPIQELVAITAELARRVKMNFEVLAEFYHSEVRPELKEELIKILGMCTEVGVTSAEVMKMLERVVETEIRRSKKFGKLERDKEEREEALRVAEEEEDKESGELGEYVPRPKGLDEMTIPSTPIPGGTWI